MLDDIQLETMLKLLLLYIICVYRLRNTSVRFSKFEFWLTHHFRLAGGIWSQKPNPPPRELGEACEGKWQNANLVPKLHTVEL
jgi:hypothetical protein